MTTSGSTNFDATRQDITKLALRLCNVIDVGEEPSAEVSTAANDTLNIFIKSFMSKAPQLWRQTQGIVFLNRTQQIYSLSSSGDHACNESDLVSTTLTAAAALGAGTITVASISGLASGDYIGIKLSDNTRQWTTINGAPSGSTVTLTATLTAAAASGATVYSYTTRLQRPLRITGMQRRVSGYDVAVDIISRQEYQDQPNKAASGKVVMAAFSPQMTAGVLNVWPTADNADDYLRITYERILEDMDSNANTLDLPVEWIEPIAYGLSIRLAPQFGLPESRMAVLKAEAEQKMAELLAYDQEYSSVFFTPDRRW